MFEDVRGMLANSREQFTTYIKDDFGRSINETTYEEVIALVNQMEGDYSVAEDKMMQVDSMLATARTMV